MMRLLQVEWLKIKHYTTFWVMMGLFTVFLILCNYGINNGAMRMTSNGANMLNSSFAFPMVWDNICYYSSYFVVFLAILVIILMTNEYQYRTNRQNIIDGWTRLDFYHAKWVLIVLLSGYTTLLVFVVGLLFGLANGGSSGMFEHIDRVFYLFLLSLHYYAFALLLAIFLKRSGLAIGMLLLYFTIIKNVLSAIMNYIYKSDACSYFLPLKCSDELLPFPALEAFKKMTMQGGSGPNMNMLCVATVVWVGVFYVVGRRRLERSDW